MKTLGNVVFIQRGETWSLDFDVTNAKGEPYMLFKEWKHPYLAITVTAARYEQKGDFRRTWWLDMDKRWEQRADGKMEPVPMKRFTETAPLYVPFHSIEQVLEDYPNIKTDGDADDPFDITNYLFYTDPNSDGNKIFKYVKSYGLTEDSFMVVENDYIGWDSDPYTKGDRVFYGGRIYIDIMGAGYNDVPGESDVWLDITDLRGTTFYNVYDSNKVYVKGDVYIQNGKGYIFTGTEALELVGDYILPVYEAEWEEYNFRIIKQFNTKDWTEQNFLFDMKILAGETVEEHIVGLLTEQGYSDIKEFPWSDTDGYEHAEMITDETKRKEMIELLESGVPLMPDYDTKTLILEPTKLVVSANIQGGVR